MKLPQHAHATAHIVERAALAALEFGQPIADHVPHAFAVFVSDTGATGAVQQVVIANLATLGFTF